MTTDADSTPWMDCDWKDCATLAGNRAGFEALRDSIDCLLSSGEDSIKVEPANLPIERLILDNTPSKPPDPSTRLEKLLGITGLVTLITIVLSIPIFAVFGLIQFLRWIFS